jgi:protein SCO1/2
MATLFGLLPVAQSGEVTAEAGHEHDGLIMPGDGAHATKIRSVSIAVPDVNLIREDGRQVSLLREMDDGRPVVLNFIFTSCGSTCPLMSQIFGEFQRRLGPSGPGVHLMSISVDPEEDTPARLEAYAHRFGARPGWQHYTGTLEASVTTQRAFGVYRGDKMSHVPATLMRAAPGQPWVRIEGLANPDELLQEYHRLVAPM